MTTFSSFSFLCCFPWSHRFLLLVSLHQSFNLRLDFFWGEWRKKNMVPSSFWTGWKIKWKLNWRSGRRTGLRLGEHIPKHCSALRFSFRPFLAYSLLSLQKWRKPDYVFFFLRSRIYIPSFWFQSRNFSCVKELSYLLILGSRSQLLPCFLSFWVGEVTVRCPAVVSLGLFLYLSWLLWKWKAFAIEGGRTAEIDYK